MAIRNIVKVGDEILRKKSFEVTEFNDRLHSLLDDMKDTLKKANGAGLACVQVGLLKRIFVVDVEEGYFEFVNPVIISQSGEQYGEEGCLSVPKKWGRVKRPAKVVMEAYDRNGKKFRVNAKGFFAKALCHEYDHLDGIIYTDKAQELYEEKR